MSTHSTIAVVMADKTVKSIYVHWDGNAETMLPLLSKYHNTQELAELLVSHGNASAIDRQTNPNDSHHSFDSPEEYVSVYYGRDRGDDGQEAFEFSNLEEYNELKGSFVEAFEYVFRDGVWRWVRNNFEVVIGN